MIEKSIKYFVKINLVHIVHLNKYSYQQRMKQFVMQMKIPIYILMHNFNLLEYFFSHNNYWKSYVCLVKLSLWEDKSTCPKYRLTTLLKINTYIRISLLRLSIALRPDGALPGAAHRSLQLLLHATAQLQLTYTALFLLALCFVLVVCGFSSL